MKSTGGGGNMGKKKNHIDGKGKGGRHTTLTDFSGKVVKCLERIPGVKKVSPGVIKSVSGSRGGCRVKLHKENFGFLATIRGNAYVQELRIYTTNKKVVAKELGSCFTCTVVWAE